MTGDPGNFPHTKYLALVGLGSDFVLCNGFGRTILSKKKCSNLEWDLTVCSEIMKNEDP